MTSVEVRAEQIRTLYRQTGTVLLTNLVNGTLVAVACSATAPKPVVFGWLASIVCVTLARLGLERAYRRSDPPPADAARWGRRFVFGTGAAGLSWGAGAFLLGDGATEAAQLLVSFVIGGMSAAAAGTLASHLPAFSAFSGASLALLGLRLLLFRDATHGLMAGFIAIYAVSLTFVARTNHATLLEAFRLRFENERLLERLSSAQRVLEETNRSLEERVAERTLALKKQADALRDAQRMEAIGRLAGGIAHDFNNLLTVILANISELSDTRKIDASVLPAVGEMRDAATRGADLVRQLLMFSRRQRTSPETLDLNQTVTALERLLSRLIGERLTLRVVLHDAPLFVRVDPSQLEQVVINLVTNARDAMQNGGLVTIQTASEEVSGSNDGLQSGRYALLSVTDTGAGMDASTQLKIFEPFFTTKEVGQGTGLGLATVYGIVEQSGGHVRVESELEHGSCFRVYLPASETGTSGPPALESRVVTLLLVEDEATVRNVTQRILRSVGHRVLAAENAERAMALAAEHDGVIELLITDVVMAGSSGPELAERLRARRPELRTLFISGYSREHVIPAADARTGVGFLPKPFTRDALVQKVAKMLR
jgi:signal transduction histidine kinase/CheY-like chemotaxis protein